MNPQRIDRLIEAEALPSDYWQIVDRWWAPLAEEIARRASERTSLIVGINGAQGSGKSTLCRFLELLLKDRGLHAVALSLDDLYLTRSERTALAQEVHPLLATRGVPGTHSIDRGGAILDAVRARRSFAIPRFDKALDDRCPQDELVNEPVDVLLFEGWCVGAMQQPQAALADPINVLETQEDAAGTWRRFVNNALAGGYAELFSQLDLLVLLRVPDFEAVRRNRALQEGKLRARDPDAPGIMDEKALERFLAHYERLTRWMLVEMPSRADIVIEIDHHQRPCSISGIPTDHS